MQICKDMILKKRNELNRERQRENSTACGTSTCIHYNLKEAAIKLHQLNVIMNLLAAEGHSFFLGALKIKHSIVAADFCSGLLRECHGKTCHEEKNDLRLR